MVRAKTRSAAGQSPGRKRGKVLEQSSADANLLRLFLDNSTEMISRHRRDGTFLYASPACRALLGYPAGQLVGRALTRIALAEDRPALDAWFADAGATSPPITYRVRHRDGSVLWIETSGRAGDELQCASRDVTKYKTIERLIENVAKEWRATFDSAQDVIIMLNSDLRVGRTNRAATAFFGLDFPRILGRGVAKLLDEPGLKRDPFGFERLRTTRRRIEVELYLPRRRRWIFSAIDPILDARGELAGAVQFLRDVSARKTAERQLRQSRDRLRELSSHLQSAREDERTAVAREIHDELGAGLTGLKLEVAWLASRVTEGRPEVSARLGSASALVDQTIAAVRRLASELRPWVLDDLGLAAAIEWQAKELENRSGLTVSVAIPEQDLELDADHTTALFRICQEALTNVARHAQATTVRVELQRWGRQLQLQIQDDGRGFGERAAKSAKSFGLLGMKERAQILGGTCVVRSVPGEGTAVIVRLPLKP